MSLVDGADYTVNLATHDFYNDVVVVGAAQVSVATLAGKVIANGAFDSDNPTFTAVTGDVSEIMILWKDTTVSTTSPLIAYYDVFSGGGMPVTPNGGNVVATVHSSGWFSF